MSATQNKRLFARLMLIVELVAPLLSCGEHAPTQPGSGGAIELQIVITSPSLPATAAVGTTVPPVSVQVLNKKNGQIIYNEPVSFVVTAGGGTVYAPTVQTDNMSGIAQDLWTLGTRAGFDTLQARVVDTSRVGPLSGSTSMVTFVIQAVALAPSAMSVQAGNGQTAVAGAGVAIPPAVLVTDRFGNPSVGVNVIFGIGGGGGTICGAPSGVSCGVTTGANGIATASPWTLGTQAGTNTLNAGSSGLSGGVTFTATGINAAANQLIPATSTVFSSAVATTILAATGPAVRVVDRNNNGVAGVAVTFTITGPACPSCSAYPGSSPSAPAKIAGVSSITTLTDANGRASPGDWTLSTLSGANTLQATAVGLAGSPVTFTAAGTAGAAALLFKRAGDGQSANVATAVATPPAIQVTDVFGNPSSSGTSVIFTVQSGGGSVSGGPSVTVTTDLTGAASVSWTLGAIAGANTLTATGVSHTVTFTATAVGPSGLNIANHAGDGQTATAGTMLAIAPAAQVTDQGGHPVAGVTVSFSVTAGQGSIAGATQVTDANGVATVGSWTLGPAAGVNELQASFSTGTSRGYTIFVATGFFPSWRQTLSGIGDVCSIATGANGVVFAAATSGVYRSTDNGATWTLVGLSAVASSAPSAVAINPTNNHVFAGLGAFGCSTASGIPGAGGGGGSGVYRSTDGGSTWTYVLGNPGAFGFGFTASGAVIAATTGPTGANGGLFISSDDGASWPFDDCCYPRSLATTSNGTILAGDSYGTRGVSRSSDAGATWTQVALGGIPIYSLVTTSADHVFAGTANAGIYRSTDGVTWTQVNNTSSSAVTSLAAGHSQVFAGLYGNGVLRSSDDGNTWVQFSGDLADLRVEALAISSNGLILAGTSSGVFVRSVP
jgi:hypothetical protein